MTLRGRLLLTGTRHLLCRQTAVRVLTTTIMVAWSHRLPPRPCVSVVPCNTDVTMQRWRPVASRGAGTHPGIAIMCAGTSGACEPAHGFPGSAFTAPCGPRQTCHPATPRPRLPHVPSDVAVPRATFLLLRDMASLIDLAPQALAPLGPLRPRHGLRSPKPPASEAGAPSFN